MRWVVAIAVLMAIAWAIERVDPPLWAKLVLEVLVLTVVITAVKAYEALTKEKKLSKMSPDAEN